MSDASTLQHSQTQPNFLIALGWYAIIACAVSGLTVLGSGPINRVEVATSA